MTLASLDSEFWLVNYWEIYLFITLGRDVPPHPSPRAPTSSPCLTYNPGCTNGVLSVPADQVDKEKFTSLVAPYRPKGVILIEYVLVHPHQAALLLLRLESISRSRSVSASPTTSSPTRRVVSVSRSRSPEPAASRSSCSPAPSQSGGHFL
jgi:hypothetical protein